MSTKEHPEPTPEREYDHEEHISITEYLSILLDEWRTLVIPFVLSIVLACVYLIMSVPEYSASGVIQVSTSDPAGAYALLELAGSRPSPVETEVEILKSRYIVGKTIQQLSYNMVQKVPSLTTDLRVSLGGKSPTNPELATLRNTIRNLIVADWIEAPKKAVFSAGKSGDLQIQLNEGKPPTVVRSGTKFNQQGISFAVASGKTPQFQEGIEVTLLPTDVAAEKITKKLRIESIGGGRKDTNLVRVTFENKDRLIARNLVNALMQTYMSFALDWRTLSADKSADFIEKQLESIRRNLEVSEQDLQSFMEKNKAMLLSVQAEELIRTGADLELEMRKVRIQQDLLRMVASGLTRSQKRGEPTSLTGDFLFDDELLGKAIGALNELEMKHKTLLSDMTEAHPEVVKLDDEIKRVRSHVHKLINASKKRIGERRGAMSRELDTIQKKLSSFPDRERHLAVLRRNQEVGQELYKFMMTKLEESRILKASTTTDKRIIDRATTPYRHSKPKRMTTLVLVSFIGLLLGIGAVFARRALDPRIRDEEEAKKLATLPVYGAIPDLNALGMAREESRTPESIWNLPKGPAAESFRTIRTNVEFAQVGEESLKVLQATSSEASEGKSTIISNLGVALSKAGHRVIIVDLDLRRPNQHRSFGVPRMPGISDYLVGQGDKLIHHIEAFNLDLIPAGNEPPESQRLLSSKKLLDLVEQWREEYDYVLLDTPPLLVADSLVISRLSDMVLFVVRPRHCHRTNLKLARNTQERMDLVKGLIINGVATRRGGYYHYYRGSYYGSKTSDTQES